mmetsp:Transcript_8388/g.12576  ORF Transcript_8388/g.12576 Transcript_8388/m.12576 type:complete len:399 (-) Transcript_8388:25-1221(-)
MEAVECADPSKCSAEETIILTLGILRCVPREALFEFHEGRKSCNEKGVFDVVDDELCSLELYDKLAVPADNVFIFVSHSWSVPESWPSRDLNATYEDVKLEQLYSSSQDLLRDISISGGRARARASSASASASTAVKNIHLWLDKACSPQWGAALAAVKKFDFFFMQYIALSENMLVLATPVYFTRLWCVFEMASFLSLHPPDKLYIGIDSFLNDRDMVMDHGVSAEEATIYRIEAYLESITKLCVQDLICVNESDREILLKLIYQNFGECARFENFAKSCALAIIAHNMSINVEFMTNNQDEDPNHKLRDVYLHAFNAVKECSNRVNTELFDCLGKLEQGEFLDTVDGESPAMRSFQEHVAPFMNDMRNKTLVTGNPLSKYRNAVEKVRNPQSYPYP